MKICDIKKRFFQRQWFSAAQPPYSYSPQRHGLAYGDVRSHQKVRRAAKGQTALRLVPYDDLYQFHAQCKKKQKQDDKKFRRQIRNNDPMAMPGREIPAQWSKRLSFKDKIRYVLEHV